MAGHTDAPATLKDWASRMTLTPSTRSITVDRSLFATITSRSTCALMGAVFIDQPANLGAPCGQVSNRTVHGGTPSDLTERGQVTGDDRRTASQGLRDRQSESLPLRGLEDEDSLTIDRAQDSRAQ